MAALEKNSLSINFAQGLDQKTDPFQVTPGRFLQLSNSIFTKGGMLLKRNGFQELLSLPEPASYLTTFNGNLLAIGDSVQAFSLGADQWTNQGAFYPCEVSTLELVRSSTAQTQQDVAISSNGLIGVAYTDQIPSSGSLVPTYKFVVLNSTTGQQAVSETVISDATTAPRIFALANYFLVVYGAASNNLKYIAINTASLSISTSTVIATNFAAASALPFNGVVFAGNLYLAWNGTDGGGAIHMTYITPSLVIQSVATVSGYSATHMSLCSDSVNSQIWVFFYSSNSSTAYGFYQNQSLGLTPSPVEILSSGTISHIACAANAGVMTALYETVNAYGYDSTINSDYVSYKTLTTGGTVGSATIISRGLGLASNAFVVDSEIYFLGAYDAVLAATGVSVSYEPTYLLMNLAGDVIAKLAYSNAGGYATAGIPNVNVNGTTAQIGYLYKDLIQAINKTQGIPNTAGVYSQTGINVATFDIGTNPTVTSEIAGDLHVSGGFLWLYDGTSPTELGFVVWPDMYVNPDNTFNGATSSGQGGGLLAQQYYYQWTYEWSDNQGNIHRSAPSVPFTVTAKIVLANAGSVFSSGASTIELTGVSGFYVGQYIYDSTTPGNIAAGTYITGISGNFIGISSPTQGNSASSPGDNIVGGAITFNSVFSSGANSITVSSTTGLYVGQIISDLTTSAHITAGTYITSISGTTVGLSQPTAGNSASTPGDLLLTEQTASNIINIPTLRQTYKTNVKIVGYRWSEAQQIYYQCTSLQIPLLNNPAVDFVQFQDSQSDQAIVGNNILYTTGGVVEDIAPPATNIVTLFDTRLWLVDAEDPNLLWYSKQVIESTPVEMSDLFTLYVSPNISAQGSTGPITALAPMDDKLVIFKQDAIYYINGTGPDNTGSNSTYSPATFITANVGSIDQHSIVMMPNGLMFQSDKGIWLLDRSLGTNYIGASVETATVGSNVLSALAIPGTNQVRFTVDSGTTLMYDYYYQQWGTFTGIPGISSTLYEGAHTFIDKYGRVFQETPGSYLDGSNPVLMSFQTGWFDMMGLQGFERAYYFYLLGTYITPHKLAMSIAYDYAPAPAQYFTIEPDNYGGSWGSDPVWGGNATWGGSLNREQWRCFLKQQKCQAFQITMQEVYDPSFGVPAGAGVQLHGLNLVIGAKKKYPVLRPSHSTG